MRNYTKEDALFELRYGSFDYNDETADAYKQLLADCADCEGCYLDNDGYTFRCMMSKCIKGMEE